MTLATRSVLVLVLAAMAACGHKAKVPAPQSSRPAPRPPVAQAPSSPPVPAPVAPPPQQEPEAKIPEPVPPVPPPGYSKVPVSPLIRIGLTTAAKEIRISSPVEFYVVEKSPEAPRLAVSGDVQVRLELEVDESAEVYRVQIAALSRQSAAEDLRRALSEKLSVPAVVRESGSGHLYQVRVGEFRTREDAAQYGSEVLAQAGYPDFLVVMESTRAGGGAPTLTVHGPENLFRTSKSGFLFSPGDDLLRVDGKPYRGILDVSLNKNGRITLVNQLGTEEYLLGVVPAEISPTAYPEFEALAAQAVAARTYALKNLGRFRSEGFDLVADVRDQVYAGASGEKETTNQAVLNTFGIAIYYRNDLINAMYSSTCGGKTEDYSEVFDKPDIPYLRSVFCSIESGSGNAVETKLEGRHDLDAPFFAADGWIANRGVELARVLGYTSEARVTPDYLNSAPARDEVRKWVSSARRLVSRTDPVEPKPDGDILSRAGFVRYAAESIFGLSRIESKISAADADYYLSNLRDGGNVPASSRPAIAYVLQAGLWRANPDNSLRPNEPIRRGDALALLSRWIETAQTTFLQRGSFVGPGTTTESARALSVKWGNRTKEFNLAGDLRLYKVAGNESLPVDTLNLIGNEKIAFHTGSDGKIDFLEVELNPTGAASDRYSPVATWDVTLSKSSLAQKLAPLAAGTGEIQDLTPSRLGKSGRAVQVEIIGSRGSRIVNGYKVRNALGLRDTLYTISRTINPDGQTESFTFHGRGWGHGVGLCQVGAFGLARSGRKFQEIIKTYYQGVEIRKAYEQGKAVGGRQ